MNLPNKLTMSRIVLTVIIVLVLLLPFHSFGIEIPKIFVNEKIVMDLRYVIAGVLFILAAITDFADGYIARKYNLVTEFGKMADAIADKVVVNAVLIIFAAHGFINPIIPIIIISRDTIVNTLKMAAGNQGVVVAASSMGKIKTLCMMIGIILMFFYNLPFELYNIRVADFLLIIAVVLSITSGIQYYNMNKKFISVNK